MAYDFNLNRFLEAQNERSAIYAHFQHALFDLRSGKKQIAGWTPIVFPNVLKTTSTSSSDTGTGRPQPSPYTLRSYAEARAYYTHPVLGPRLEAATQAALDSGQRDPLRLFACDRADVAQFRSCLTLFANVEAGLGASHFFRAAVLAFWNDFDEETLGVIAAFGDYHGPFRRRWAPVGVEAPVCKLPMTRGRRRRNAVVHHHHLPPPAWGRRVRTRTQQMPTTTTTTTTAAGGGQPVAQKRWEVRHVLASRVDSRGDLSYQVDWADDDDGRGEDDEQWYAAARIKHAARQLAKYHDENPDQPGPPCRLDTWWRACVKGRQPPPDHPDDDKPAVDRFRSGRTRRVCWN